MSEEMSKVEEVALYLPEIVCFPEIKSTLGERWPTFVHQMQATTASFEDVADETALQEAIKQILFIFLDDAEITEIITRPDPDKIIKKGRRPQPSAKSKVDLQTIANRFVWLIDKPDEFIEDDPNKFFERADRARQDRKTKVSQ